MNKKPISPVCWVPTFCPYVFRYGSVECTNCFLDFSHYASLDIEAFMESVSGNV